MSVTDALEVADDPIDFDHSATWSALKSLAAEVRRQRQDLALRNATIDCLRADLDVARARVP